MKILKCFKIKYFIICIWLFLYSSPYVMANHPIIALGVNHAPPYSFVEENSDSSGLIIDIMQRIGSELDFELQVVSCPFPRCLKMAKEGKLDILGGLVKTEERNQYLDFIEPAYMALNSSYVFYSLKEKNLVVNEYEQLKDKRIAVMRNAAYFELFDSDAALNKIIVSSEKVAVDMLLKDRVDLVIAVEETADYSIKFLKQASHRLQKLNYRHTDNILGYAAISRKYQNIELLNKIKQKMRQFQKSGVLTQLVKPYNLPPINKP